MRLVQQPTISMNYSGSFMSRAMDECKQFTCAFRSTKHDLELIPSDIANTSNIDAADTTSGSIGCELQTKRVMIQLRSGVKNIFVRWGMVGQPPDLAVSIHL